MLQELCVVQARVSPCNTVKRHRMQRLGFNRSCCCSEFNLKSEPLTNKNELCKQDAKLRKRKHSGLSLTKQNDNRLFEQMRK